MKLLKINRVFKRSINQPSMDQLLKDINKQITNND